MSSPTIAANEDFNVDEACEELHKSMKGLGTDEGVIITCLTAHDNAQRQEIAETYKTMYGSDLVDDLKSELGGEFEDAVVAFLATPRQLDARELRNAMKGAGTTESTLIEILCTKNNEEIEVIKEVYNTEFERDLEEDLQSETGGHFERLLVSQISAARCEECEDVDDDQTQEDAQEIYDAGEGQCGTDETAFNLVLCRRNFCQLRAVFDKYYEISEKNIEEVITSECTGTLEDGYLAIVKVAKDTPAFFAERLNASMAGGGTSDTQLIRIIVSRSELDLGEIKEKYEEKYEKSLAEAIESDCGGDYKRMLVAIVG